MWVYVDVSNVRVRMNGKWAYWRWEIDDERFNA
jgi:hypothetical protein